MTPGYAYGLPLPDLWFALLFAILATFLVLDGFDFGVGAIFALRDDPEERETLMAVIGPFWDGNEVWLVVFGGALFAAFPDAYARLFSRHYLLMFAILAALILRGLGPELAHQRDDEAWQRWWGRSFAAGSVAAPLLLGVFVGNWLVGAPTTLTPVALLVGLATVALSVVMGAAFVRLKLDDPLAAAAGRLGQQAAVAFLLLVVATLAIIWVAHPDLRSGLLAPATLGLVALTVLAVAGYVAALRTDRHRAAFAAGALTVYALVAVVATLMHPFVDPASGLTVADGIVSPLPLALMSAAATLLLPLVAVYFALLYSAFGGPLGSDVSY